MLVPINEEMFQLSRKPLLVLVIVLVLLFLYGTDSLCILREGEIVMHSSGEESIHGLLVSNGCKNHHLSAKGGVHVVGIGRMGIESRHVGYIEDFNRIEKLQAIDAHLDALANKYRFVGIVANGGTHHKPALARIRDDVAIEIETAAAETANFSLVGFFRKYDMGRFLSVDHGCCRGYVLLYDSVTKTKIAEKVGELNSALEHKARI
ncbi:unnamed protein product [Ectocarpus sp. 6 AP-2014]